MILFFFILFDSVLYSNYISFIVIVRYLIIKQKSLIDRIAVSLNKLTRFRGLSIQARSHSRHFPTIAQMRLYTIFYRLKNDYQSYCHLYEEAFDYNRFWTVALSFFVLCYVLLIAFIIYLLILSDATFTVKYVYSSILIFHVALLTTIIKYCGDVVVNNERLTAMWNKAMAKVGSDYSIALSGVIKVPILLMVKVSYLIELKLFPPKIVQSHGPKSEWNKTRIHPSERVSHYTSHLSRCKSHSGKMWRFG